MAGHCFVDIDPDEPANMVSFFAEVVRQALQSTSEKAVAPLNMLLMSVTFETSHFEMSMLNDAALLNMLAVVVTFATFQPEMSALNDAAPWNKPLISSTSDVSHFPIGPCLCQKQSPYFDSFRHSAIAVASTALDVGLNTAEFSFSVNVKEWMLCGRNKLIAVPGVRVRVYIKVSFREISNRTLSSLYLRILFH